MARVALMVFAVVAVVGAREAVAQPAAGARPPNILYIMSDDHAAHALSCYGSKINRTPNLDKLAAQGMRFENAFVTNSLCGPSRACLLTGKYSHANGFLDNKPSTKFDGSQPTVQKLLKPANYQSAIVGKWHLGSDPVGFDHWDILPGQGVYKNPAFVTDGKKNVVQGYVTDIITDKAIAWMEGRDKSKPFVLFYHHKAPHRPWVPDEKHAKLYEDQDIPVPETFDDNYANRGTAAKDQEMSVLKDLTKTDTKVDPPAGLEGEALKKWKYERFIKDYVRCIAAVDDNVGRVMDYLDKAGLADNTIVIYTSDNGFFLGDHGWFDKRFMYEHSLRVPLIVRYPGHVKAGSVSQRIVLNVDHAPTFLDFAGQPIPADMQGKSYRQILEGKEPADWRQVMYYHYYEFPQPHHVHPHYGVRSEQYKLVYFYTLNEWELYDLKKDPNELKNVYLAPEYTEVREKMTKELEKVRKELGDK